MEVQRLKRYLFYKLGSPITVIYYGSRNRREKYQGFLWKVYNNVFTIKLLNGNIKTFAYNDILTKVLRVFI